MAASSTATAGFAVRDLGVIFPTGTSSASSINANGQAAGMASNASGVNVAVRSVGSGGFAPVTLPPDAVSSLANGINGSGEVAGNYRDMLGGRHGFATMGGQAKAIVPLMVGNLSGTYTQASGINNGGQVVGTGDLPDGSTRAFVATGGGAPVAINPVGTGGFTVGAGINNAGSVVGTSEIGANGPQHAFFATLGGNAVDLNTRNPSGNFAFNTFGVAIADNGDIAGNGAVGRSQHAFFASNQQGTALVDLGLLPGASSSIAYGLNQHSREVGELDFGTSLPGQPNSQAFLWDLTRGMFNLNTLISTSDQALWTLTRATGINDADMISGEGYFNGVLHGFVLAPIAGQSIFDPVGSPTVPEPPTALLSAFGLAILGAWSMLRNRLRRGETGGRAAA